MSRSLKYARLQTYLSAAQLFIVIIGIVWAVWEFYYKDNLNKAAYSDKVSDRIYDPVFIDALNAMLNIKFEFENQCKKKTNSNCTFDNSSSISFEQHQAFWDYAYKQDFTDKNMFIIISRLDSLSQCWDYGTCDRDKVQILFPLSVFQALEHLRPFFFSTNEKKSDYGWKLGATSVIFLDDYKQWYEATYDVVIRTWADGDNK